MNSFSVRTKNQNILRSKTKTFKDNIKQSQARIRSSSSLNNLANKLYSSNINNQFTPTKGSKLDPLTISRNRSMNKLNNEDQASSFNPESQAMDGLSLRTYHVPCFAELNTNLLIEKKNLENRISDLKQAIALEKRNLSKADCNAKKNQAKYNTENDMYNQCHKKSLHLQSQISATNHDNYGLKQDIKVLHDNISKNDKIINDETKTCQQLDALSKNLKLNFMREDKQKNMIKMDLVSHQKVMTSLSINSKQLQNERAMLLVQINQSVKSFKL